MTHPTGYHDPSDVGALATRAGLALIAMTAPVVVGAAIGVLADASTVEAAVTLVLDAMDTPLVGPGSLSWLLHVSLLGFLGGCWLLGAGLLLEGLFD